VIEWKFRKKKRGFQKVQGLELLSVQSIGDEIRRITDQEVEFISVAGFTDSIVHSILIVLRFWKSYQIIRWECGSSVLIRHEPRQLA